MDTDGYPTPEELESIRTWPSIYKSTGHKAHHGLMEFIEERWRWADAGYWTWTIDTMKGIESFSISTGGWSGNEDIIQAMERNIMFWATCWQSSKRGGHYEFEVKL